MVEEADGRISAYLHFDAELYDPAGVHKLFSAYLALLERVAVDSRQRLADLQPANVSKAA
jgi:hypothetical protein